MDAEAAAATEAIEIIKAANKATAVEMIMDTVEVVAKAAVAAEVRRGQTPTIKSNRESSRSTAERTDASAAKTGSNTNSRPWDTIHTLSRTILWEEIPRMHSASTCQV